MILRVRKGEDIGYKDGLGKLSELGSNDRSKVNQVIMLCMQAFMIMLVLMKPLCKYYIRAKYECEEKEGAQGTSSTGDT